MAENLLGAQVCVSVGQSPRLSTQTGFPKCQSLMRHCLGGCWPCCQLCFQLCFQGGLESSWILRREETEAPCLISTCLSSAQHSHANPLVLRLLVITQGQAASSWANAEEQHLDWHVSITGRHKEHPLCAVGGLSLACLRCPQTLRYMSCLRECDLNHVGSVPDVWAQSLVALEGH